MSKTSLIGLISLLCIAMLLTACGPSVPATPTEAPEMIYTRVAETVYYSMTQTVEAMPTLTPTPVPPTPTATLIVLPTVKPTTATTTLPTAAATQIVPPSSKTGDYALYLYNRPDNFTIAAGGDFNNEVIAFENIGTTTWSTKYTLRFLATVGSTKMWDVTSVALAKDVKPGGRIEIFVAGIAPTSKGTYLNRWALYTDGGMFIPGSEMYIKVVVP
jgi:Ig-like domain from next to BRCA1 gene